MQCRRQISQNCTGNKAETSYDGHTNSTEQQTWHGAPSRGICTSFTNFNQVERTSLQRRDLSESVERTDGLRYIQQIQTKGINIRTSNCKTGSQPPNWFLQKSLLLLHPHKLEAALDSRLPSCRHSASIKVLLHIFRPRGEFWGKFHVKTFKPRDSGAQLYTHVSSIIVSCF